MDLQIRIRTTKNTQKIELKNKNYKINKKQNFKKSELLKNLKLEKIQLEKQTQKINHKKWIYKL